VFGLWGALLLINRRLGRDTRGLLAMIAINGVIGFVPGWNIAWQGHLGGLLTGALCGGVLAYTPATQRRPLHAAGLAVVAGLLLVIVVVKLGTAPAGSLA
jgi:membrane associated rhomboid family serine protease